MNNFRQATFILVIVLLLWPVAGETQETSLPPLPQGLESQPPARQDDSGVPLPEGLGESPQDSGGGLPSLPEGLMPASDNAESVSSENVQRDKTGFLDNPEVFGFPLHGFWELRNGWRTQDDSAISEDASLAETRFQLESERFWGSTGIVWRSDFLYDAVMEEFDIDVRTLYFSTTPLDFLDLRIGRQILTWGTGDLVFINDLFPKDWQSFLIGRDEEYLKAPADAVKAGIFTGVVNIDLVYVPAFEPDRYIRGERISFWNDSLGRRAGNRDALGFRPPDDWFTDDEIAYRLYRTVASYEVALYGYHGYWKSPASVNPLDGVFEFPGLSVYGASVRGNVGPGIGNVEFGYYDSSDDSNGDDPLIRNSELRFLVGYEQEAAKDFTVGAQYYVEYMLDHDNYRRTLPPGIHAKDEDRHVLTLRLTQLLFDQDVMLSLFTFYSPSDGDAYLRPKVQYKINDDWISELGANIFFGDKDYTFFGQFEDNTNVYASVRYSF